MTKKQFYEEFINAIKTGANRTQAAMGDYEEVKAQINSRKYSTEHIQNVLEPAKVSAFTRAETEQREAKNKAHAIIDEYIRLLEAEDALKGSEINDDARLLTCGIKLNKKEILAMLDRNSKNRTMSQLIIKYAEENDIKINVRYVGNSEIINNAKSLKEALNYAEKWMRLPNAHRLIESCFGAGTAAHEYFAKCAECEEVTKAENETSPDPAE